MRSSADRPLPMLRVALARAGSEAFLERLRLRVEELAQDLGLPGVPDVFVCEVPEGSPPRLHLDGRPLRIPQSLARRQGDPAAQDVELAERVSAAVLSARWHLLEPHLPLPLAPLRAACELGLDLEDLRALAPFARDPVECAWRACERSPARFELLLPPETFEEGLALDRLATDGAERFGLAVPPSTVELDRGLDGSQLRLRLRRVRLPARTLGDDEPAAGVEMAALRALGEDASQLVDAEAVAELLLDPDDVPLDALHPVLASRESGLPAIAQALRRLYADGLTGARPVVLRQALLRDTCEPVDTRPGHWPVALPGARWAAREAWRDDGLAARLRAALVGPALRRDAVGGFRSVWTLAPGAAQAAGRLADADLDRLAARATPCARAGGVLLTTTGDARPVRAALARDLPTLLVCDESEWPRELKPAFRGTIDLPATATPRGTS